MNLTIIMKRTKPFSLLVLSFILGACSGPENGIDLDAIGKQLLLLDEHTMQELATDPETPGGAVKLMPRTIEGGELKVVPGGDWTSGFFPGTLWYMYELTGEDRWKDKATAYTWALEDQQYNASNHDVGFRMFCSFGNALRLTGGRFTKT